MSSIRFLSSSQRATLVFCKDQKGIALVQVIFIIALLAAVVSVVQIDGRREMERTFQKLAQIQAEEYLLSGESIAMQGLWMDKSYNGLDHLTEQWAQPFGPLPLDAGQEGKILPGAISVDMIDLNRKFNLNWLQYDEVYGVKTVPAFESLLLAQGLDVQIAQNLRDWFDPESSAAFNYNTLDIPFQPSQRSMVVLSELARIEGVSAEAFEKLKDYVAVYDPLSRINLNTVDEVVFEVLTPQLQDDKRALFFQKREENAFISVNNMLKDIGLNDQAQSNFPSEIFEVISDHFSVQTQVTLDQENYFMSSVLNRNRDNKISVLSRQFISITQQIQD